MEKWRLLHQQIVEQCGGQVWYDGYSVALCDAGHMIKFLALSEGEPFPVVRNVEGVWELRFPNIEYVDGYFYSHYRFPSEEAARTARTMIIMARAVA